MHVIADILERHERGQSDCAIAHDLGLSRVTVRKYRELAEAGQVSSDDPRPTKGGNPSGTTISTVLPYQAIRRSLLGRIGSRTGARRPSAYPPACRSWMSRPKMHPSSSAAAVNERAWAHIGR